MVHGRYLILTLAGTAVASCKECSITYDATVVETSNSLQYGRTYTTTRKGWKLSCSYLVVDTNAIKTALNRVGQTYAAQLRVITSSSTTRIANGNCICTSAKISGSVGNLISGSFEFQGTGDLTI